jgi:hypothetical protein
MKKISSVHFAEPVFWTIERHAKAHAMRRYRSLWRGLDSQHQWKLECCVYRWRSRGVAEDKIGEIIEVTLNAARPWRLSNAKLLRAFNNMQRTRINKNQLTQYSH